MRRDRPIDSESVAVTDGDNVDVVVRHRAGLTRATYQHRPFDVVGWDGCLDPFRFSIHNYEQRVGRFHMPPPTHQTFEGPNFVVCSFCPRPFDFDPEAIAVPYNHANVDSDEMLFYVGGDFMSRKGAGIGLGSISLHPSGFTHGPQPGSVEAAIGKPGTDELAVMIDTFRPLHLGPAALMSACWRSTADLIHLPQLGRLGACPAALPVVTQASPGRGSAQCAGPLSPRDRPSASRSAGS